jgi:hypothetical protein
MIILASRSRALAVSDLSNNRIAVQITLRKEFMPETFCDVLSYVDTDLQMRCSSFKNLNMHREYIMLGLFLK